MLNELQFYEIDTEYLGDESGDEDDEGEDPDAGDMQNVIAQNLKNKKHLTVICNENNSMQKSTIT